MTTLVTGATGLIGRQLVARVANPVVLSRGDISIGAPSYRWDASTESPPIEALRGAEVIFHLAGDPVADGRWTSEKRRRIHDSRVLGTRHLVATIAELEAKPRVLVSASAVGYYGDRGDEALDERSSAGSGFLADVCRAWEHEALDATKLGVRVACVRFGVVLAKSGGALGRMLPAFKLGLGARIGNGRQWMPWIHVDDAVGILLHASVTPSIVGPVNAVAPIPITNNEFTQALGKALQRPALLAIPAGVLNFALGETGSMLLASQRVFPSVANETGYRFKQKTIDEALREIAR